LPDILYGRHLETTLLTKKIFMKSNILVAALAITLASCGSANTDKGVGTGTANDSTAGTTGNTANGTSNGQATGSSNGTVTGAGGSNMADSTKSKPGANNSTGTDTSGTARGAQSPGTESSSIDTSKGKMHGTVKMNGKKGSGKMNDSAKSKM